MISLNALLETRRILRIPLGDRRPFAERAVAAPLAVSGERRRLHLLEVDAAAAGIASSPNASPIISGRSCIIAASTGRDAATAFPAPTRMGTEGPTAISCRRATISASAIQRGSMANI